MHGEALYLGADITFYCVFKLRFSEVPRLRMSTFVYIGTVVFCSSPGISAEKNTSFP